MWVLDPRTGVGVNKCHVGIAIQHFVPSYDMSQLYATDDLGDVIRVIDPRTGQCRATIKPGCAAVRGSRRVVTRECPAGQEDRTSLRFDRSSLKGIPRMVRHEVACGKWLVDWRSAVTSMT